MAGFPQLEGLPLAWPPTHSRPHSLQVVYMSDVLDHISTIVEDMETLFMDARDLIDLVFNTIAHYNNNSMQMLAVVSTIFLPITFIAGVSALP